MRKNNLLCALVFLCLLLVPSESYGVAGTCTATADGAIGDAIWSGANCSDVNDNCANCPDTDDTIDADDYTVTFDASYTFTEITNASTGVGGGYFFKDGTTTIFTGAIANKDCAISAGSHFHVEGGATVKLNSSLNSITCQISDGGRLTIQGQQLFSGTIASATPTGASTIEIVFNEPIPFSYVSVGDFVRITSGYNTAHTFEISALDPLKPTTVTVDVALTDTYGGHDYTLQTGTVQADARQILQTGGSDLVSANDGAYMGKFIMPNGTTDLYPVVRIDEIGVNVDKFYVYFDLPVMTQWRMVYGFEAGGDTAIIERPAKIEKTAGGNFARINCKNGAKCTIKHARFLDTGIQVDTISNDNRPTEFYDFSYVSVNSTGVVNVTPVPICPSGSTGCGHLAVEYVEIWEGDQIWDVAGEDVVVRKSLVRDSETTSGSAFKFQGADDTTEHIIEDTAVLRFAQVGGATAPVDWRRLWAAGIGRQAGAAGAGVKWGATTDDPGVTTNSQNSGLHRVLNSVIYTFRHGNVFVERRVWGQRKYAVNSVLAYAAETGSWQPGTLGASLYNSLMTYNPHSGGLSVGNVIGSISSFNSREGLDLESRRCEAAVCAPCYTTHHVKGNLIFKNTQNAITFQDHCDYEFEENTIVSPVNSYDVVLFNPIDPDETTGDALCVAPASCGVGGAGRPSWFTTYPVDSVFPTASFKNNIIGNAPAGKGGMEKSGAYFTDAMLGETYNYFWRGTGASDKGTFPAVDATSLANQADPFTDSANDDYTIVSPVAGDGTNMGPKFAGILADNASMPKVYTLIAANTKTVHRDGLITSVDADEDGECDFVPFTVSGRAVKFTFASAPTCADTDTCATLQLRLIDPDNDTPEVSASVVPVSGSGTIYSVQDYAFCLLYAPIRDLDEDASLEVTLTIGADVSPTGVWPTADPMVIPSYAVPSTGSGIDSGATMGSGTGIQ